MILPGIKIIMDMKENKRVKTKIRVGSVVKSKVGEMEDNTREGGIGGNRIEEVGCVQAVVGKNNYVLQF